MFDLRVVDNEEWESLHHNQNLAQIHEIRESVPDVERLSLNIIIVFMIKIRFEYKR